MYSKFLVKCRDENQCRNLMDYTLASFREYYDTGDLILKVSHDPGTNKIPGAVFIGEDKEFIIMFAGPNISTFRGETYYGYAVSNIDVIEYKDFKPADVIQRVLDDSQNFRRFDAMVIVERSGKDYIRQFVRILESRGMGYQQMVTSVEREDGYDVSINNTYRIRVEKFSENSINKSVHRINVKGPVFTIPSWDPGVVRGPYQDAADALIVLAIASQQKPQKK